MGEPIYIETWEIAGNSEGNILDIAYTRSECPTAEATDMFRRGMAEAYECVLLKLLRTRKIEFEEEWCGSNKEDYSQNQNKTDMQVE